MPTPHLLARAVIRADERVLVVRAAGQSHCFLPGGHLEDGEGLRACLRRELREELDVWVQVEAYLGAVEHEWTRDGIPQYEINHCFSVSVPALDGDTRPEAQEQHLTFEWARVDQLDEVSLEPAPLRRLVCGDLHSQTPWWASTVPAADSCAPRS